MILLNRGSVVKEEKVTNVFYSNSSRIKYSEPPTSCLFQPRQSAFRTTQLQYKDAWKLPSELSCPHWKEIWNKTSQIRDNKARKKHKKAGLSNNDWKTLNRTLATPRVESAALTLTLWAALKQGYCIGTCLLSTPYTLGFPAVRALTPTWWSQHGVVKIHGLHSGCHVLTVCLQQAAVCQSLSCQT